MRVRELTWTLGVLLVAFRADAAEPVRGGFSVSSLDAGANPCEDFFQYACGGWVKANPIPGDEPRWGTFNALADRNRETLKTILEEAVASARPTRAQSLISGFYGACMDEAALERKGAAPLRPELDRIAAIKDKGELPAAVSRLHTIGVPAFFGFGSEQDFKDATRVLAITGQGGMGLPDRDYYFRDDAKSKELRDKYVAHVARMFELLGDAPQAAKTSAATVMEIETGLAKGALDAVSKRDPQRIYHLMKTDEWAALSPALDVRGYLAGPSAPAIAELNVTEPEFAKAVSDVVKETPLAKLKTYLRWQLVHEAAPFLSSGLVNENFAFFGQALEGAKELRPRWKRCSDATDEALGEALGQIFVERTFGPEGKQRMKEMVANLEGALRADIRSLPWMSEATKAKAMEKLNASANKVGYPDTWRDYSALAIDGDLVGNVQRANAFEFRRQLAKIGKPVDRGEWGMTPPTVNAYYNPLMNDINFPVGILQPPFFDLTMDDAVNYGGIGGVIGHELTHGFDDQGRQFAANGNLEDWWTAADASEFEKRASCVVEQYGAYTAVDDVKLNGKLTLGENVADNGGVRIAYMALMESLKDQQAAKVDGFTPEQRFFLGWGQVWCASYRPELARLRAQTDPHSLPRFRVNGVVSNMPEFREAFACPATAPMVRGDNACRVW